MVNLRRSSAVNILSASMPVLNTIGEVRGIGNRRSHDGVIRDPSASANLCREIHLTAGTNKRHSRTCYTKSVPATPEDIEIEYEHCDVVNSVHLSANWSPSRSFNKADRHAIKQLSTSTPAMAHAHSVARGPTDPDGSAGAPLIAKISESSELIQTQGLNKARQKKFNRHFKQVGLDERVLDYYSCALVGDILLHGRLYVTKNYFAFYSNVFGYVTKLLIPIVDVLDVSKEKTAKIIPNAVGISTEYEKHVFGSLLSRDSTYKFMVEAWHAAKCLGPAVDISAPKAMKNDIEDSASGDLLLEDDSTASGSGNEETPSLNASVQNAASAAENFKMLPKLKKRELLRIPLSTKKTKEYWNAVKPTTILAIATALLVSLYLSAGLLLYRIAVIQNDFHDYPLTSVGNDVYHNILKWQSELHSRSASEFHEFLNANLNQIAKVRLSLEALSMLIPTESEREVNSEKSPKQEDTSGKGVNEKAGSGNVS